MDLARYAELFRTESREHLAEIDTALPALERDEDTAQIAVLFRSTHTIKGMAASMGYSAVEQLSHGLESLLDALRSGARRLDGDVIALLFDGTDALSQSVNDAVEGRGNMPSVSALALIERMSSALDSPGPRDHASLHMSSAAAVTRTTGGDNSAGTGLVATLLPQDFGSLELSDEMVSTPTSISERLVEIRLSPDAALKGVRAMMVLSRLEAMGTIRSINPAQHTWNDDGFDGAFTIALGTTKDDTSLEATVRAAGEVARVVVRQPAAGSKERETLRHVRIDLRRLDTLLDLVGELVITRDRLIRTSDASSEFGTAHSGTGSAPNDRAAADRALKAVVHDTARLITALQEEVLRTRMVPVGQVFDRFPRLVRDVTRDLGKDITFVTEGREIELDRSLLDAIGDPIVHLLRNAIDHGIESPEARRRAGKPAKGRLILRAARDRAAVVVQVEDDGGGIDRDRVLARAQAQGLVDGDVTALSDEGLLRILSRSGFSTAATVTSVSGRGVGIDVVASRVRALGGALELSTVTGRGSMFTLRLPVTLAIVRALLVKIGSETYALPASHVIEALEYDPATLISVRGQETLTLRDDVIPLLRMRTRFGLPQECDDGTHVVMVEAAGRQTALQVDCLIGQQDVVVKPYDAVQGAETLFAGATILGDGTPALIVDLGSLT
ncbi:MAG: chemotaxis protein CheA [Phycisphaerae bacterium]|nr:chemotaxis protein CheA [Gemmatimonadaceae bacterium]